jgi:hypothetical protein
VKQNAVTDEQLAAFSAKLSAFSQAYENFSAMSKSVQTTYLRRYLSFKSESSRENDFLKIIDRLNQNLKPM